MKLAHIRSEFIQYFMGLDHTHVPSSALVPHNDPTLLFTNAGMVQFKDVFLGQDKRSYNKAVSVQRCLRAGGKHNDLENVGYTARHHTFFEMLGNFSFGDYFKKEAITYAWYFLTQVLKLPAEKLWVTVYEKDDEAASIWLNEVGVSKDRFSRCGEKDNFWSMGDTGPCGPCSEIFYDHGPDVPGGPPGSEGADLDRYIEIWNMVFMQYNRDSEGVLHPLPKPSVDTGMGLERIAAVMQGVHNNYDIDLFAAIISGIASLGKNIPLDSPSIRVIADHIRACSFLIMDGVLPSNEGRGYVLRRIIRRAVRHGEKLGLKIPFFYQAVPFLVDAMADAYPELQRKTLFIQDILQKEEEQFNKTLAQGLSILKSEVKTAKDRVLSGELVFKLYDTYGFPFDLTADFARENQLTIDEAGFDACMAQQKSLSRQGSQFEATEKLSLQDESVTTFHGYEKTDHLAKILNIYVNGQPKEQLFAGEAAVITLDESPFYAESGGQVGDIGWLLSDTAKFEVKDTQKSGHVVLHHGVLVEGQIQQQDTVDARVDSQRRNEIKCNHSATHLLHAALKTVLGDSVLQKGSLVDADYARFDFAYTGAINADQLLRIERLVNEKIQENMPVTTEIMTIDEAKQSGAVALFGEKYSDSVRVLSMGKFSKELCGGTHVRRTGDIGLFKIKTEYGVASGVRRMEICTGQYALDYVEARLNILTQCGQLLNTPVEKLTDKVVQLQQILKQQEKEISKNAAVLAAKAVDSYHVETLKNGISFLVTAVDAKDMNGLRMQLDQLKSKHDKAVIVLYATMENKLSVVASVSKILIGQDWTAVQLVRALCGGQGGGRPDMAQGGSAVPADLDKVVLELKEQVGNYYANL